MCSEHFAKDRLPLADDVLSLKLPELYFYYCITTLTTSFSTSIAVNRRDLSSSEQPTSDTELESNPDSDEKRDVAVNTDITMCDMESMGVMKSRHKELESKYEKQLFRMENIKN